MSKYEVLMLLSVKGGEEATNALKDKFLDLISKHGTLGEVQVLEKRKPAYPVQDETDGVYVLAEFEAEPSFPTEFNRIFGITDGALRAMIVNKEEK